MAADPHTHPDASHHANPDPDPDPDPDTIACINPRDISVAHTDPGGCWC